MVAQNQSVSVELPLSARFLISCNNIWRGVALVETIGSGGTSNMQITKLSTFKYWDIAIDQEHPKNYVIISNTSEYNYELRWHWTRI